MEKKNLNNQNTNSFVTAFLRERHLNKVDWVNKGKYFRKYATPPRIGNNVHDFSDGLKEAIPEKLRLALQAQKLLKDSRAKRLKLILENIPEKNQWFYLLLEAHLFSEYFFISKWISYWLNLWYEITNSPKKDFSRGKFSEFDIQKAKEFPIQDLYEGVLRKSGDRFSGLCPFHSEKHPSFFIFPNNSWHCFGACCEGGDSIKFLMKLRNIDFIKAVNQLNYGHN